MNDGADNVIGLAVMTVILFLLAIGLGPFSYAQQSHHVTGGLRNVIMADVSGNSNNHPTTSVSSNSGKNHVPAGSVKMDDDKTNTSNY